MIVFIKYKGVNLMYKVIAMDRKTNEEVRHEWIDEQFVGRWVEIFLDQGYYVIVK